MKTITCKINDEELTVEIEPGETLLEMLRNRLGLTGTKKGCEVGECGACTVLVDNTPISSCVYLASRIHGKEVLTIEGLSLNGGLTRLQQAFIDAGAIQCGFCTPGMVLTAHALINKKEKPSYQEIKTGLSGNMCRCGGYENIIRAVQKACE